MIRVVLDTNVLVSARRSRAGAANALLRAIDGGQARMLISVPLFLEYEAVLLRPEHRSALRLEAGEIAGFLDYLAEIGEPIRLHYLWRPQLGDIADEMVLETAINGRADAIVTFNQRHFSPADRFGITIWTPEVALRRIA